MSSGTIVALAGGVGGAKLADGLAHLRTFGYNYAGQQKVELVNLCVSGFGLIERPELPKLAARDGSRHIPLAI